jgi:phosphate transport system protein
MSTPPDEFAAELSRLREEIIVQGRRVQDLLEDGVEVLFAADADRAAAVIEGDVAVDRADVQIEQAAVRLLGLQRQMADREVREILTIVKTNNELERIADCAVNMAEEVQSFSKLSSTPPPVFRVMANSVVAMVRDCSRSLEARDTKLARLVLHADDAVDEFKKQIVRQTESKLASGDLDIDFALSLISVASDLERVADHATNVCEQVIYLETGLIVRHGLDGWGEPTRVD